MKISHRTVPILVAVTALGVLALRESTLLSDRMTSGDVVATGRMTVARFDHTATLLPNGKVLIAGGMARNGAFHSTAELYDPASGTFSSLGEMQFPHGWGAAAALLPNGLVLLAGGSGIPSTVLASAELYDPSTGRFSPAGRMTRPRAGAVTALLQTGDVLFVGGEPDDGTSPCSAELYEQKTGLFSPAGAIHTRDVTAAVLLKNGQVLVVGAASAELYDPASRRFSLTGRLGTPRTKFGAARLPDGRVLIAGGQVHGAWGEHVRSTELYDPVTGEFTPGPDMAYRRFKLRKGVVALDSGRILLGGGAEKPEVFDPVSRSFLPAAGGELDGFLFSTATRLADGRVLLAGGYRRPGEPGVDRAWLYRP